MMCYEYKYHNTGEKINTGQRGKTSRVLLLLRQIFHLRLVDTKSS